MDFTVVRNNFFPPYIRSIFIKLAVVCSRSSLRYLAVTDMQPLPEAVRTR